MRNLFKIIISGIILFNYSCSGTGNPVVSNELTQKVLEHHLTAVGENNLSSILDDYSEESVVVTPDSTYIGLKQIESFFVGIIPAFPTEGTVLEIERTVIENELAYIVWRAKTPIVEVPLGTDTFIVEDGKIKLQTFAGIINPIE
jgi:hypothetical protein